jgi:hypothetical protein
MVGPPSKLVSDGRGDRGRRETFRLTRESPVLNCHDYQENKQFDGKTLLGIG